MSFSEGASYRINIMGEDSSMILDSYTSRVKATIVGADNTVLVDKDTNTILADLSANIVDTDGNVAYNTSTNTFSGNLQNDVGGIAFNKNTGTFFGNFRGTFRAHDGDVIINHETKSLYGGLQGDLYDVNGVKVYDHATNTFTGTFVGNVTGNVTGDGSNLTNVDADSLNGLDPTYYLDWRNITNKPTNAAEYGIEGATVTDFDDLENTPTTLAGYNIIDGATRQYVDDAVADARPTQLTKPNGETVVDVPNSRFYGTLIGDILKPDGTPIFEDGNISATIKGAQVVDFQNTVVLDAQSKTYHGNIHAADDSLLLDYTDRLFIGKLEGDVFSRTGLLIDAETGLATLNLKGNLINKWGAYAYDINNDTFSGTFSGSIVDSSGDVVIDTNARIYLPLSANIIDEDGLVVYDNVTRTFNGSFIGSLSNHDGEIIANSLTKDFYGNFNGNVYNTLGNTIVDAEADIFYGTLRGLTAGTLVHDETLETVFDITESRFYTTVTAPTFRGSLAGDLVDSDGIAVVEYATGNINANDIRGNLTGNVVGNVTGNLTGNLLNNGGTTLIDAVNSTIKGSIVDFHGNVVINQQTKRADLSTVVTGTLDAQLVETDAVSISGNISINQPVDGHALLINAVPLTGRLHSHDMGIIIKKSNGTYDDPTPINPGDHISAIGFGGRTQHAPDDDDPGWNDYDYQVAGSIGFRVAADADTSSECMPGEFVLSVCDYDGNRQEPVLVNANGEMTAKIKDLTVVGETGNTPASSAAPSEWLEITVNGNTRYMPLYT